MPSMVFVFWNDKTFSSEAGLSWSLIFQGSHLHRSLQGSGRGQQCVQSVMRFYKNCQINMLYQQRVKTIDFALYFCHIFPSLRYLQVFLVSSQRVVQFGICLVWCVFFFNFKIFNSYRRSQTWTPPPDYLCGMQSPLCISKSLMYAQSVSHVHLSVAP